MSTRTTLTSGWEPTAATPRLLPVAPGLAKTYMKLFVNRLSYCEQSPYGDHRYHRPKHPELKTLAGRRAAMEMPGQKWGSLPHTDRTNEIYLELVKERRLPSPYRRTRFPPPPWSPTSAHRSGVREPKCPVVPARCAGEWESQKRSQSR